MQTLTHRGEILPWSAFLGAMRTSMTAQEATKGAGLRILTETVMLAYAGRADRGDSRAVPGSDLASMGPGWRSQCARRAAHGRRQRRLGALQPRATQQSSFVSTLISSAAAPATSATRGSSRRAGDRRPRVEPAVRRRKHADVDGRQGGSPAAAQAEQIESIARALAADLGVAGVNSRGGAFRDGASVDRRSRATT